MNDRSKASPNDTLDRVLAGLNEVEPSPDLERRVLRRLEQRMSAPQHRRSAAIAGLCTLLLGLLAASFVRRSAPSPPTPVSTAATRPEPASTAPQPQASALRQAGSAKVRLLPRARRSESPYNGGTPAHAREDAARALAIEEMRAPSHPEPEVPLTEEEALLLRILNRQDPVQLAALDPSARAAENEAERAAFQRFFEMPSTSTQGEHR